MATTNKGSRANDALITHLAVAQFIDEIIKDVSLMELFRQCNISDSLDQAAWTDQIYYKVTNAFPSASPYAWDAIRDALRVSVMNYWIAKKNELSEKEREKIETYERLFKN